MYIFIENRKTYKTMSVFIDSSKILTHFFHHFVLFSNVSRIYNARNMNVMICLHIFDFIFIIIIIQIFFVMLESLFFFSQEFMIDDDIDISS